MKKEDADQLIRCVKECWWRVLLLLMLPLAFVVWAIYGWPVTVVLEDGATVLGQAIGSILAIWGAVYAAKRGARATVQLKDEQRNNAILMAIRAFADKVDAIVEVAKMPSEKIQDALNGIYGPNSMDGFVRAIQKIPALELPTPKAVASTLELQRLSPFFIQAVDRLQAGPWGENDHVTRELKKLADENTQARKDLLSGIGTAARMTQAHQQFSDKFNSIISQQQNNVITVAGWLRKQVEILVDDLGNNQNSSN